MNRATQLACLLEAAGAELGGPSPPLPSLDRMSAELADAVLDRYRALGGRHDAPRLRPGKWDLIVNGFAVELDENLHFNRYRAETLEASVYERLPRFPLVEYRTFSRAGEGKCLAAGSYGGKWSNPSCEGHFGPPGALVDLDGAGAPRWRQRAVYDLKDLAPLDGAPPGRAHIDLGQAPRARRRTRRSRAQAATMHGSLGGARSTRLGGGPLRGLGAGPVWGGWFGR